MSGGPPRASPAPPPQRQAQPAADSNPPSTENATPPPARQKHPKGDRSHIAPTAQPIVDNLSPAMAHIKSVAPQSFKPQVDDMDKRINILFDHLNNDDLLSPGTVQQMVEISEMVRNKNWNGAQALFTEMQRAKGESEGGVWMVSLMLRPVSDNILTNVRRSVSSDSLLLGRLQSSKDWSCRMREIDAVFSVHTLRPVLHVSLHGTLTAISSLHCVRTPDANIFLPDAVGAWVQ